MKLVVATNNAHKLDEMREIFKGYPIELLSINDIGFKGEIPENGSTYEANSTQKATKISEFTNLPIIADDSGIEIEMLGEHFPGIYSHRYALEFGGYEECNKHVSKVAAGSKAKFTCNITLVNYKNYGPLHFIGTMEGTISPIIEGEKGFGYDPIFIYKDHDRTIASMPPEIKNTVSHRYNAIKALLEFLKKEEF